MGTRHKLGLKKQRFGLVRALRREPSPAVNRILDAFFWDPNEAAEPEAARPAADASAEHGRDADSDADILHLDPSRRTRRSP